MPFTVVVCDEKVVYAGAKLPTVADVQHVKKHLSMPLAREEARLPQTITSQQVSNQLSDFKNKIQTLQPLPPSLTSCRLELTHRLEYCDDSWVCFDAELQVMYAAQCSSMIKAVRPLIKPLLKAGVWSVTESSKTTAADDSSSSSSD